MTLDTWGGGVQNALCMIAATENMTDRHIDLQSYLLGYFCNWKIVSNQIAIFIYVSIMRKQFNKSVSKLFMVIEQHQVVDSWSSNQNYECWIEFVSLASLSVAFQDGKLDSKFKHLSLLPTLKHLVE